jgi:hypothetical protein
VLYPITDPRFLKNLPDPPDHSTNWTNYQGIESPERTVYPGVRERRGGAGGIAGLPRQVGVLGQGTLRRARDREGSHALGEGEDGVEHAG